MRFKLRLSTTAGLLLALSVLAYAQGKGEKVVGVTINSPSPEIAEAIKSNLCGYENNRVAENGVRFVCEIQQDRPKVKEVVSVVESLELDRKISLRVALTVSYSSEANVYGGAVLMNEPYAHNYVQSATVTRTLDALTNEVEKLVRDRLKPSLREAARK